MKQQDNPQPGTHFVFDPMAARYDRCNHVFSFGIDHYWRRKLVKTARPHAHQHVLDLCSGTGDIVYSFLKHSQVRHITGADLSESMIQLAMEKQVLYNSKTWMQHKHVDWHVADAARMHLASYSYDIVSCAFGIRNIRDRCAALKEIHRVLKANGKLYILEFSLPTNPLFRFVYCSYLRRIMPLVAKWIVGSREPLDYLARSIQQWHTDVDFTKELHQSGFRLLYKTPLTGGIVTFWTAVKVGKQNSSDPTNFDVCAVEPNPNSR
jgi:demethylmenaquinone methyltransferase/2-methoxy-6-polyprenyl-1,4-benzoquinol methylase